MNTAVKLFFLSLLGIFFIFFPQKVLAQESHDTALTELQAALENDMKFYESFQQSTEEIAKISDPEQLVTYMQTKLATWKPQVELNGVIYKKFSSSRDTSIAEVAQKAAAANANVQAAFNKYSEALQRAPSVQTEEEAVAISQLFAEGDELIKQSAAAQIQAVDAYNNASGYNSSVQSRDALLIASALATLFSGFLFFKHILYKKKKSAVGTIKSKAYLDLFKHSLWLTGGLAITTVWLSYALEKGGTYYIVYGPVLAGAWNLFNGVRQYFTTIRKQAVKLATAAHP